MTYQHARIEDIIEHNENTRSFVIDKDIKSNPGQFVMVWLPGIDEKPFSLSSQNMITVKKVGPFTEKLFEKSKGDCLDVRGPYGNGFPEVHMNTAIGGGCGIAPLFYLIKKNQISASKFILAGKTKSDLLFLDEIKKELESNLLSQKKQIIAATEDGSYGIKGIVTDIDIPKSDYNYYVCGPEKMMQAVAEKLVDKGTDSKRIYLSLERYMKCGVGICGECSLSGYRTCKDGPVFRYDKVKNLPHFTKYRRIKTGELKLISKNKAKSI